MNPQPPAAGPQQPPAAPPDPQELDQADQTQTKPAEPASRQIFRQIKISQREEGRLRDRLWHDFLAARSDHDNRINRFRRYFRMWRGLNQTRGTNDVGPDYQVPLVKWNVFGQWAKIMQALLGEDAEIIARPTAPSDAGAAKKAGHYMTWRFFEYMQATIGLAAWVFRACLFGRAFAEIIYEQEYYWERDDAKNVDTKALDEAGLDWERVAGTQQIDYEVLAYDGPRLRALWPSQIITPAQDNVESMDDFEWIIRRDRITPQQLLDGEQKDKYFGIVERWDQINSAAQQRQERDYWWDDEKIDSDEAEGVDHVNTLGNRDSLEVWRWYGKWRLPLSGRDVTPDNIKYRQSVQSELMVTYLPKVGIIVGVQDLRDLYPRLRKRNPFLDLATVKDGSYWPPGAGELLEDIQNELTINHALFRKAGMLSVGPVIFYKPNGEFDPDTFEYDAGTAIPTADPTSVKVVTFNANLDYSEKMTQVLKAIAELVTGVSDQSLGRASDRPNAPQTAAGQAMLLQEGNVRATLDMMMLREDLSRAMGYIWALDREYADAEVFFRVTDDDAVGFDVNNGFGTMTSEEREHPYGFDVRFATSVWSREAKKQMLLQLYGLSMQNPIVQTDPKALWTILNRVWESFGESGFQDVIPEPPHPERAKMPKEEWTLMMKGEVVHVLSIDDDQQHMIDHRRRLEDLINEPAERANPRLQKLAIDHIIEHERQIRQKQILQGLAQKAMEAFAASQPGLIPQAGGAPPGLPAGGVAAPPLQPAPETPAIAAPAAAPAPTPQMQ